MIKVFAIDGNDLVPLARTRLPKEDMLQTWITKDPSILGLDVVVIGREVVTDFGGRIDILAIDRDGTLTVVELKRDKSPREAVAQILDYASWVNGLSTKDVYSIAARYLGPLDQTLDSVFHDSFGTDVPENLNTAHNMVIVASELDALSKRIVEYLSEVHGVSINTLFFGTFDNNGRLMMAADWLMDQEEVVQRRESRKNPLAPWTGLWYVNVDDCRERSWQDCREFGFLGAGGGRKFSDQLQRLPVGAEVFAYQRQAGYVGYGVVTQAVCPASEFTVDGKPLVECVRSSPELLARIDPDTQEYVVGMEWKSTFPIQEAKTFPGVFANPNVVCRLRHPETIEFLQRAFGVSE